MKIKSLLIAFAICFLFNLTAYGYPTARITIKALDENGTPMEGMPTSVTFQQGRDKYVSEKGFTGIDGLFTASSENLVDDVAFGVRKDGYYESVGRYRFTMPQGGLSAPRWLPWNPEVTLVMRKIENPVAMYARDTRRPRMMDIPVVGKEVGFDLIEYDWIAPYGKGKQPDFIFKAEKSYKDDYDFEVSLALMFPNKFDGIQLVKEDRRYGSRLKLPRHAPLNGYQSKLSKFVKRIPGKPREDDIKEDNNYIFRVRSEEKDGKLIKAMYGKIQGDISVGPRAGGTVAIGFKYYLNPDYTRNLEFDPKQNLFKNLKSTEEVGLE